MDRPVTIPAPQAVSFFGFRTGIKGNAHFINEHEVLYPAGSVLVIHHLLLNTQKFLKPADQRKSIKEIVLSPNRKIVAITCHMDKMNIMLYDIVAMRRKKILALPEGTEASEFVSFNFTFDGKGILAVTGEPEWMLYQFNWEKGKLESSCKATIPGNPGTVAQVVPHPNDNTACILVGPGLFRMMAVSESVWRQFGWQKADQLNICCAAHLSPERILAATKDGRFLMVENNELKGIVKAMDLKELDPKSLEMQTMASSEMELTSSGDREIRCLVPFLRGFLYAQGSGTIFLYETDTDMVYRRKSLITVPPMDIEDIFDHDLTTIRFISINPSMEKIVVATDRTQLYMCQLWNTDTKEESKVSLEIVGPPLHHGPLSGLVICQWKPIFMTVGKVDRTVRLWNYETETQEIAKQYLEDIFCIALHPTGFYVALGFCDKLRYFTVSINDFVLSRELPIRNCRVCSFSNHGHFFAAANGHLIQIFSVLSFQNVYNLRGHFGRITKILWAAQDLKVVSCGLEGAVYEWDIATSSRANEVITKTCGYTDIAVTVDGRTIYAVGTDGLLKVFNDSEVLRQVPLGAEDHKLDAIAFSRSNLMLFVAGMEGAVFSVKFPLSEPLIYNEYLMHCGDITGMALTWDDRMLITISEDGGICLWKLTHTEGKAIAIDKEFSHCTEILINRKDLSDKINAIKELNTRLTELTTEHEYQINQVKTEYEDIIATNQLKHRSLVDELKETAESVEAEHVAELNKLATESAEVIFKHDHELQELEATYFQKLIVEYNKYTNLDQRLLRTREDYEKQLEALQQSKAKALEDQQEEFMQQIRDKNADSDELLRLYEKEREDSERMRLQIEDDADREIVTLRVSFETSLREERDNNVRLRSEVGILKKKLIGSQREVDELRLEISQLQSEQAQYQKAVHTLERDSADLRRDVQERDSVLQQKERTIADLKRQTQELDKYRFVLNYKINELKSQIEPKGLEIKEKNEQIQDMEQEIQKLQTAKDAMQRQRDKFKEKYTASDAELATERKRHQNTHRAIRRMWIDFHGTSILIQHPKELKEALKVLYQKYSGNPSLLLSKAQGTDAQCEFMRQREHLERTVASLKRQVFKGSVFQHGEHDKIMEHNIMLMKELKNVRGQLKKCLNAQSILEKIMAPPGTRPGDHKVLQQRLINILNDQEDIDTHGARHIRDLQKMVDALTEEVQRLTTILATVEQGERSMQSQQATT